MRVKTMFCSFLRFFVVCNFFWHWVLPVTEPKKSFQKNQLQNKPSSNHFHRQCGPFFFKKAKSGCLRGWTCAAFSLIIRERFAVFNFVWLVVLVMQIKITSHARERMHKYAISELWIKRAIEEPDSVIESEQNRKIAQKRLNGLVLRGIYEIRENLVMIYHGV